MPRPIRVEFAGAVYHVMARGNERREVFRDDKDRQRFLETVGEAVHQFGLRLHAYCLMLNHYHLVLETPRANLSRAMAWMQTAYTTRFNARHRRSGHLFQGRFKAQLVEADEYARWLVEYVHLNPVRPRKKGEPVPPERLEELRRYEWSSHRDYAGLRKKSPEWLCLDWLRYWGRSRREAQVEYRKAMELAFGQEVKNPWQHLRRGMVLGGDELYHRARGVMERKDGLEEARWAREEQMTEVRQRLLELIKDETDQRVQVWARVRLGCERGVALAREYGYRDGSGVTQVVKRLEKEARQDKHLARKLAQLAQAAREG